MALPTYQDYVQHFNDQKAQTDAFMKQSGKIYDPTSHSYVTDPNFISASQSPEYAAAKSIASKAADSQFTNSQPLDPKALQGYIDAQGNPAKAGITQQDLTSGKYSYQTPQSPADAAKQKADTSQYQIALSGINKIKNSINNVNFDGTKFSGGYLEHALGNWFHEKGGTSQDIANIKSAMPNIIESLKALTGSGRITNQEIQAIGTISPYDTKTEAMTKINQYADLLNKAIDLKNSSQPTANTTTKPPAKVTNDPLGLFK